MNPFQIGQTLHVQFGTRQAFTVAALRTDACLMRFPHRTPMSKWYAIADLLRWNPDRAPKPAPVYLLPAMSVRPVETRPVPMQQLTVGDVILIPPYGGRFAVASIGPVYETRPYPLAPLHVVEPTREAVLVNVVTGERRAHQFRNFGHGAERKVGRLAS